MRLTGSGSVRNVGAVSAVGRGLLRHGFVVAAVLAGPGAVDVANFRGSGKFQPKFETLD